MSYEWELAYAKLAEKVLQQGEIRKGRNGITKALFGTALQIDMTDSKLFPILTGRKMYYKGVFGEFAAMVRKPKHVDDFKEWGCNYWGDWSDEEGNLNVDYGNAWLDYNGVNQLELLVDKLKHNPTDRRLLITSWRPDRLDSLSLPCCHHTYQWFVREGQYLDMLWMQRSVDTMIGLPSDIILAAVWNIMLANEVGLKPGKLTFSMGDTHIYEEHWEKAEEYINHVITWKNSPPPKYELIAPPGRKTIHFVPEHIGITSYDPMDAISFLLKE